MISNPFLRASNAAVVSDVDRAGPALRPLDTDRPDLRFRQRTLQVDMKEAIVKCGTGNLDAVGQYEGALELTRGDAAVEVDPVLVVGLPAADQKLIVLHLDGE